MSTARDAADETFALAELLRVPLLRFSRRLRQESQKSGLSAQDHFILALVRRKPGIGVSELADVEGISRPTMSTHVKRLERDGWIVRADDAADGRRSGLTVTPEGERKLDVIRRQRTDWLAGQLAHLTAKERAVIAAAAEPLTKLTRIGV